MALVDSMMSVAQNLESNGNLHDAQIIRAAIVKLCVMDDLEQIAQRCVDGVSTKKQLRAACIRAIGG